MSKQLKKGRSRKKIEVMKVVNQWIVGESLSSIQVADHGGYHPRFVLILDQEMRILGSNLMHPDEPVNWPEIIRSTMSKPKIGGPRRPTTIRTDDPLRASEISAIFPDIEVIVAPTPEIGEIVREFEKHQDPDEDNSYLLDDTIDPEKLGSLFQASKTLYNLKPWERIYDTELIRVDIPELNISGGCISIIGNAKQDYGLLYFPSMNMFNRFYNYAQKMGNRPSARKRTEPMCLSLSFSRGSDLSAKMRKEIDRYKWPVADANAYPVIIHLSTGMDWLPYSDGDVDLLYNITESFGHFFEYERELFNPDEEEVEPVSMSLSSDSMTVQFTYPYEAYELINEESVREDEEADVSLDLEKSIALLKKDPDNTVLLMNTGHLLLQSGIKQDREKALKYLEKARRLDKSHPLPPTLLAIAASDERNYRRAIHFYRIAADLYLERGDTERSNAMLDSAAGMISAEGWELLMDGNSKKARNKAKQALKSNPYNIDAMHLLGYIHLQFMESNEAEEIFEKAVELGSEYLKKEKSNTSSDISNDHSIRVTLQLIAEGHGISLAYLNRHREALKRFQQVLDLDPEDKRNIGAYLGDVHLYLDQQKEAEESIRKYGERSIGFTRALLLLCQGEEKEAEILLKECVEKEPFTGIVLHFYQSQMAHWRALGFFDRISLPPPYLHKQTYEKIRDEFYDPAGDQDMIRMYYNAESYAAFSGPLWIRTEGASKLLATAIKTARPKGMGKKILADYKNALAGR